MVKKILWFILAFILITVGGFYVYTLDFYRATPDVDTLMSQTPLKTEILDNLTVIFPDASNDLNHGIIFYPGGKVEAKAYLPLLIQLSEKGFTTVLVEMPFNLAVFDSNAAKAVITEIDTVLEWSIMGHSLGGAMASSHLEKHAESYENLVLLAAYPVNDAPVPSLAIYGTYDRVLDLTKVVGATEIVPIEGGNHAYFGNYGEQEGDGAATLTRLDQQIKTVERITEFILKP